MRPRTVRMPPAPDLPQAMQGAPLGGAAAARARAARPRAGRRAHRLVRGAGGEHELVERVEAQAVDLRRVRLHRVHHACRARVRARAGRSAPRMLLPERCQCGSALDPLCAVLISVGSRFHDGVRCRAACVDLTASWRGRCLQGPAVEMLGEGGRGARGRGRPHPAGACPR